MYHHFRTIKMRIIGYDSPHTYLPVFKLCKRMEHIARGALEAPYLPSHKLNHDLNVAIYDTNHPRGRKSYRQRKHILKKIKKKVFRFHGRVGRFEYTDVFHGYQVGPLLEVSVHDSVFSWRERGHGSF
jgi:hypothetical protein